MKMLLDAHTLVWSVDRPEQLGNQALAAIRDPGTELLLSAGTVWELSIKVSLGKLVLSMSFRDWIKKAIEDLHAEILPIKVEHAVRQAALPFHYRDPFDRLIAAQAQVEDLVVASRDVVFDRYGVSRLW